MKDFKGVELQVGDTVLYTFESGGVLHEGIIERITEHSLTVRFAPDKPIKTGKIHNWIDKGTSKLLNASNRVYKLA